MEMDKDRFEAEFAARISKRAQSKPNRRRYISCNALVKPNSVSKELDACRRTYPEQSTSDDDERLMQYKPPARTPSRPAPTLTSPKPAPPSPAPSPASIPPPDDLPHEYQQLHRLQTDTEARLELTTALLRTRTEELSVAQAFMVTADRVSVAEVVRAVEEVNDLVFQCAVDLSDAVLDARATRKAKGIHGVSVEGKGKGCSASMEGISGDWGAEVVRRLERDVLGVDEGEGSTVLFEAMVQNVLIEACAGVTKTLCFADSKVDQYLKEVWERIKRSHEPCIAKNWLAMTASRASESTPTDRATEVVTRRLWNLVLVAGWQESASWNEAPIIADRVKTLMSKSLGIREMLMQGVLSAEVEVYFPRKECWFDETCMTDTHALGGVGSPRTGEKAKAKEVREMGGTEMHMLKRAVCATALGVACFKPKAKAEGAGEKGAKAELALKPKVLLHSTLEEWDA
ncbi:hypothetical protein D9611_001716 [Ephemerocybe angulata]|uniref:Uncharacterized protein n=1 Tax=Ephemerocybe angulata TaxID=980116 RepID=A0A8H5FME5_9AGAR|nr:hypothetical protein D9611_001716 [Tulosesus angulatus]